MSFSHQLLTKFWNFMTDIYCNCIDYRGISSFLKWGQVQGYYNTGWFNSKIRSRANPLICQQTNIKAKLKFFSDKGTDF